MEAKTAWRCLDDKLLIDLLEVTIEPGCDSKEKFIQFLREQSVLPTIYPTKDIIPNSPEEPDQTEIVPYTEPTEMPFEDIFGTKEIVYNSWTESMGNRQFTTVEFLVDTDNENSMPDTAALQRLVSVYDDGNEVVGINVVHNNMEAKTAWQHLNDTLLIDIPNTNKTEIEPGCYSKEKIRQTIRGKSILPAIYSTINMLQNSPEEPDQTEIVPYYEPLIIPLEDVSQLTTPTKRKNSMQHVESKRRIENLDYMNNEMVTHNTIIQQPATSPVYGDNRVNHNLSNINNIQFENMMRANYNALTNNVNIPFDGMITNEQSIQQTWLNQSQQQYLPYHLPHNQRTTSFQFTGLPNFPIQHYQNWVPQQPPNNGLPNVWHPIQHHQPWVPRQHFLSNTPLHFGGRSHHGHIAEDNFRGNNLNTFYGDKIDHNNQQYNRRKWDYRMNSHHVDNRRMDKRS